MTIPYPNLKPVRVDLQLDAVDSCGLPVGDMAASSARPMALSLKGEPLWYGFVINDEFIDVVQPGTLASCTISFLNHDGAKEAFCSGASILFGDGASTKGVIRIVSLD